MVCGNFKTRRARITRHSKRSTAKEFKIQTSQLRDWISKKSKLLKAAPYIQKLSIGARPKYPELETELIEWFRGFDLRIKLLVDGFMSRNNLVNRRCTTTTQHLPETYLKDQNEFLSLVLFKR
ncbi:21571_t:CDS:2, partial [Gigaspora rosea]